MSTDSKRMKKMEQPRHLAVGPTMMSPMAMTCQASTLLQVQDSAGQPRMTTQDNL